ncbi:uncharacterized protein MONOS_7562 [Monocercomonoides exilis]|uniref:uncharacterized protein n=1 Tax=Monocercomonoides exilis TaxID=2049356 RepID=UPI003559BB09|nr:hypothetical protein MONOS_7562 [Monocercomonoides exilis]|eukprot:MONOS_7562.1-p1 / transcript=MONOS_7562.1 / gene=MONOS_7562 / organism=Monocercomonoides_exilis_PA203 / gene_product=unspecified product / transcript_product=unspecified product / location=Mono_scaffold00261:31265-32273(+) / protein_length=156 / sequence_SO=supercontig / SO=protein_coding / is_pseudo=false
MAIPSDPQIAMPMGMRMESEERVGRDTRECGRSVPLVSANVIECTDSFASAAFEAALTHVCVHPVCEEKAIEMRGGRASVFIRSMAQPQCSQRSVEVLMQVPGRSIVLQRGSATRTRSVVPGAYVMQTVSHEVYFQENGEFMHYPALVMMRGRHV